MIKQDPIRKPNKMEYEMKNSLQCKYCVLLIFVFAMILYSHSASAEKQQKPTSASIINKIKKLQQFKQTQQHTEILQYKMWRIAKIKLLRVQRVEYRKSQNNRAMRISNILKKYHENRVMSSRIQR